MKLKKVKRKGKKIISCIYLIVYEKTGQIYVGQAEDFYFRMNQHIDGIGIKSNSVIDILIQELGIDFFSVFILEKVNKTKLKEREDYWINILDADKNLNFNIYNQKKYRKANRFLSRSNIVRNIKNKYIVR